MAVYPQKRTASATPTLDTGAYADGDLMGGKLTLTDLLGSTFTGVIETIVLRDLAKQSLVCDVVFFNSNPTNTTFTDQAAFDVHDTDIDKIAGVVNLATASYRAFNDSSIVCAFNVGLHIVADSDDVYCCLVTRGAPTYGASDLKLFVVADANQPF